MYRFFSRSASSANAEGKNTENGTDKSESDNAAVAPTSTSDDQWVLVEESELPLAERDLEAEASDKPEPPQESEKVLNSLDALSGHHADQVTANLSLLATSESSAVNKPPRRPEGATEELSIEELQVLMASVTIGRRELEYTKQSIEEERLRLEQERKQSQQRCLREGDELHQQFDQQIISLRELISSKTVAECESLRAELSQQLATDIHNSERKMQHIFHKLETEIKQHNLDAHCMNTAFSESRKSQGKSVAAVEKRAEKLQQQLLTLDTELHQHRESCSITQAKQSARAQHERRPSKPSQSHLQQQAATAFTRASSSRNASTAQETYSPEAHRAHLSVDCFEPNCEHCLVNKGC